MKPAAAEPAGRPALLPQVAAVAAAVVIFTLIYDPFHVGALSFLALAPITLVFSDPGIPCSLRRAALCGFAFGLAAAMAIVGPWMYTAAVDYFDRSRLWSFSFTLLVNAGYVALFYVPTFVGLRLLAATPPLIRLVGAASVWIAFEALRAADPAGNHWALLGQGLSGLPLLPEAAAYGGVWTLGWAAALCGSAVGVGLQRNVGPRQAFHCTITAIAAPMVLVILAALVRFEDQSVAPLQPLRVAIVQAEIPSRDLWDPAQRMAHWNSYLVATGTLAPGSVDLVVWPENAVPFLLDADAAARTTLMDLASRLDAWILVGAPRSQASGEGRAAIFNSVYGFAPGASQPRTYDKQRLLPFVESAPAALGDGDEAPQYTAGTSGALFDVHGWRIAPLLCFESVYPQYARAAVLAGAHLLVNMSNDAWFAGGAGPEQHYSMSVLRTLELRRPMVRAANGGISAALRPDGTTIGFPIERQKAVRTYEIPSPPRAMTMTAKHGDFVALAAGIVAALALAISLAPVRMDS